MLMYATSGKKDGKHTTKDNETSSDVEKFGSSFSPSTATSTPTSGYTTNTDMTEGGYFVYPSLTKGLLERSESARKLEEFMTIMRPKVYGCMTALGRLTQDKARLEEKKSELAY